jgi:hypothetical protein
MKINFRQGIIRARLNLSKPNFLEHNVNNNTITVDVTDVPVQVAIAYKSANYLIEYTATQTNLFGPFTWNPVWGEEPLHPTYYLYWDVNLASGAITTGYTYLAPTSGYGLPSSGLKDQHHFDLNQMVTVVYDGLQWVPKARVFAGFFAPDLQSLTHYDFGSQVGYDQNGNMYEPYVEVGYVLHTVDGGAIHLTDGTLMTSGTQVRIENGGYSSPFILETACQTLVAAEPIPAFVGITPNGDGTVGIADGFTIDGQAFALSTTPGSTGQPIAFTSRGIVKHTGWNWDPSRGTYLYCGANGQLVQGLLNETVNGQRIGFILDRDTVILT